MHKGDDFSAKPLGKSLFHCQNVWSGRPVLTFGKHPEIQWKLEEVSPVFKKDCCLTKSNYKPSLSIWNFNSLKNQSLLWRYFSRTRIPIQEKSGNGYRSPRPRRTVEKEIDKQNIMGIVSMDLSKAFDRYLATKTDSQERSLNAMELTITPPTLFIITWVIDVSRLD